MDIIIAAIAGALGNLSSDAVKAAYKGMKDLLHRKFGAESDLADAVKKLEQKPDAQGRQLTLKEEVETAGADKDEEIIKAAEVLLEAVKAQTGGKVNINQQTVSGSGHIFSQSGNVTVNK